MSFEIGDKLQFRSKNVYKIISKRYGWHVSKLYGCCELTHYDLELFKATHPSSAREKITGVTESYLRFVDATKLKNNPNHPNTNIFK